MKNIVDQANCTGCKACGDVCPTKSISFNSKDKLFDYPTINQLTCVDCGKCQKTCPVYNLHEGNKFAHVYYMAWSSNEDLRSTCTSGGIGTELNRNALKNGYYICGALFDENWHLSTKITNDVKCLERFKGSKYLQSDCDGVYKSILEKLKNGDKVFFVGTPCQVAALDNSVPSTLRSLLLTCEIICHGVNSPIVWADYVKAIERKYNSKLVTYNFRSKSHGWQTKTGAPNLRISYSFANGKKVDEASWKNQFHYWFGKHFILRQSCLDCRFRGEKRHGDITIGDFWGIDKIKPEVDTQKGISVLIASSERGYNFIQNIEGVVTTEISPSDCIPILKGYLKTKKQDVINKEISTLKEFENRYISSSFKVMQNIYPSFSTLGKFMYSVKQKLKALWH